MVDDKASYERMTICPLKAKRQKPIVLNMNNLLIYGIKYPYWIRMIFKQMNLIPRLTSNI